MTRSVASLHSYPLNASRLHPSPDARIRTSGRDISPVSPDLQRIFNVHRFRKHDSAKKAGWRKSREFEPAIRCCFTQYLLSFRQQDRARILTDSPIHHSPDCANATNIHRTNEAPVIMTKLQFKGSWNEVKGKLKQRYG